MSALPFCRRLFVEGEWRLIDLQTRETLYAGTRVVRPDGAFGVLEWAAPPANPNALGVVFVRQPNAGHLSNWSPSEIGAKWIDGTELP